MASGNGGDTSWVAIAICFMVFPPLGLILLIRKLNASMADDTKEVARRKNRRSNQSNGKLTGLVIAIIVVLSMSGLWGVLNNKALFGLLAVLYGAGLIAWKGIQGNRTRMYKKYAAIIGNRRAVSIPEIASAMPVSYDRACRDLQAMIDNGLLPENAYLDMGNRFLMMDSSAVVEIQLEPEPEPVRVQQPVRPQEPVRAKESATRPEHDMFHEKIDEIRALNVAIEDEVVSEKIDRIERLTASIFAAVEDSPQKMPQISKFMNYYLPTTLKLLNHYSRLERQSPGSENIARSKHDIESILDKLVEGFEHQLDQLYSADVIDITSDINVLETMMAKDGLTRNEYVFRRPNEQ